MRDHKKIRGLNPKKMPLQQLAQYCAAVDAAAAALKESKASLEEALCLFMAERLAGPVSEGKLEGLAGATASDLIYVGRDGAEPLHPAAQDFMEEARQFLIKETAKKLFAFGVRAGFNRPGELAVRLRQEPDCPISLPLEAQLAPAFWQRSLKSLWDSYGALLPEGGRIRPAFSGEWERAEIKSLVRAYEEQIRKERDSSEWEEKAQKKEQSRKNKRGARIRSAIVETIPDNYIDLFPLARSMERHFVLHIGPTNSGKTHDAMEALAAAATGIYLGPLRLLAFEQFERLNAAGIPCNLVTGEERIEDPWAVHQASTIEMLNTEKEYDVAVIDEAQMIGDPDRGGAWTAAILGVCAREVHVCAAPIARGVLIRLIKDCGDTYSLVRHERMTPLSVEEEPFRLEDGVQKGDALIVFSKRSVHGVGAYLQGKGIACSVIYGALPYDVRREQAKLFASGENPVVVATDAIGMGMNLPIRRVVFLEMEKYDGISLRELTAEEIKQIAGRAGRYGIYPEGRVSSLEGRETIRTALEGRSETVKNAVIDFPESLLGVDASLREIIERWAQIEIKPGYTRADPARMLKLCRMIENITPDKRFLYDCISMTFDEEDVELLSRWRVMCAKEAAGDCYDVEGSLPEEQWIRDEERLSELEAAFKLCDLLYGYCEKFDHTEFRVKIMWRKNLISARMTQILATQSLSGKTCKSCGRPLPWNERYGICSKCFARLRGGRGMNIRLPGRKTDRPKGLRKKGSVKGDGSV